MRMANSDDDVKHANIFVIKNFLLLLLLLLKVVFQMLCITISTMILWIVGMSNVIIPLRNPTFHTV